MTFQKMEVQYGDRVYLQAVSNQSPLYLNGRDNTDPVLASVVTLGSFIKTATSENPIRTLTMILLASPIRCADGVVQNSWDVLFATTTSLQCQASGSLLQAVPGQSGDSLVTLGYISSSDPSIANRSRFQIQATETDSTSFIYGVTKFRLLNRAFDSSNNTVRTTDNVEVHVGGSGAEVSFVALPAFQYVTCMSDSSCFTQPSAFPDPGKYDMQKLASFRSKDVCAKNCKASPTPTPPPPRKSSPLTIAILFFLVAGVVLFGLWYFLIHKRRGKRM